MSKNNKNIFTSDHYNKFIFILLLLQFVNALIDKGGYKIINGYLFAQHLLSYKLGFVPRAFFGSTIGCLTNYLSFGNYCFLLMLLLFSFYVCIFLFFIKIRKISKNNSLVDILIFFTLSLPTSWIYVKDFGRFDIYLFEIFLFCAITCWYCHPSRWLTPFLIIMGTLLHEAFLFMYLSPILAILFFKKRDNNRNDLFLLFLSLFVGAIAFCLYIYCSSNLPSLETINQYCLTRTNYKFAPDFIDMSGHIESIKEGYIAFIIKHFSLSWLFNILFSIPFVILGLVVLYLFWKQVYTGIIRENNFSQRIILLLSSLTNIILFIGHDYNRWIASFFSVNIVLLFLILSNREKTISSTFTPPQTNFIYTVCAVYFIIAPGNCWGFSMLGEKTALLLCKLIQSI